MPSSKERNVRNISHENTRPTGVAFNMVLTVQCKACMGVTKASSTRVAAWASIVGGGESNINRVFNTFATV